MVDSQPHPDSYYFASANRQTDYPEFSGTENCDVCVIGGGVTGLSSALHLSERGYRVILLEGNQIGWVVECTKCGKRMEGSFYEESDSANSYRAEQLGVCVVHQLMFALSLFYSISNWETKSSCDNYGAIKISRRRLTRIKPSMKCADVLRNIRTARKKMTTRPDYYHVFGHMDDWLSEDQLSFEQKLNKRCDVLAKAAVDVWIARKLARTPPRLRQLLPFESVAVLVNGKKITGDIAENVRFARGMEQARNFLVKEK